MSSEDFAGKTRIDTIKSFGIVKGEKIPMSMIVIEDLDQVLINILMGKTRHFRDKDLFQPVTKIGVFAEGGSPNTIPNRADSNGPGVRGLDGIIGNTTRFG